MRRSCFFGCLGTGDRSKEMLLALQRPSYLHPQGPIEARPSSCWRKSLFCAVSESTLPQVPQSSTILQVDTILILCPSRYNSNGLKTAALKLQHIVITCEKVEMNLCTILIYRETILYVRIFMQLDVSPDEEPTATSDALQ